MVTGAAETLVDTAGTTVVIGATVVTVVVVVVIVAVVVVVVVVADGSPEALSLKTKTSLLPADVKFVVPAPGSKSTVLVKSPMAYTLPEPSAANPFPSSWPAPPMCLAHAKSPVELNFNTYASIVPTGVKFVVPAPGSKSAVAWK